MRERRRIVDALTDAAGPVLVHDDPDPDPYLKLARKLGNCCRVAQVVLTTDDEIELREQRCRSRLCPRCARLRARALAYKLQEAVRRMNSPRFLTLTLAHRDQPLRDQLRALTAAFKELRRSKLWRHHFDGGAYTLEVVWNHSRAEWHPHLHCLVDGRYCPQSALADAWERATGDSRIVDIRLVKDARQAGRYVASYCAKSSDTSKMPAEQIVEWADQVHGLRMIQTFGALHGQRLDEDLPERSDVSAQAWADELARDARRGDTAAQYVLNLVINPKSGLPCPRLARAAARDAALIDQAALIVRAREHRNKGAPSGPDPQRRPPPPPDNRTRDRPLWGGKDNPASPPH
jgi:hypothetical protein